MQFKKDAKQLSDFEKQVQAVLETLSKDKKITADLSKLSIVSIEELPVDKLKCALIYVPVAQIATYQKIASDLIDALEKSIQGV